jgi:hypothetical protein
VLKKVEEVFMSVALIGGMDRLVRGYITEAQRLGINLKVFTKPVKNLHSRIGDVEAIIVFTDKVSHQLKDEAKRVGRLKDIPVLMHHSCGICRLRDCLRCIKKFR